MPLIDLLWAFVWLFLGGLGLWVVFEAYVRLGQWLVRRERRKR